MRFDVRRRHQTIHHPPVDLRPLNPTITFMASLIRMTVHFSGHVQGVGFRYTVRNLAERRAVAGYVENLSDGRVKLVVEGASAQAKALVADVRQQMDDHIHDVTIDTDEATGEFGAAGSFEIRY